MPALPRFAIDLLQEFGSTRIGGALETRAFLGVARAAALDFARVRGVTAVYLTGSWTRPAAAAPGYSDIDFMIAVDIPTLRDELLLREGLHATQRRWNTLATLFKHVDYVEARDVETLMRGGNVFWVGADDRFVALAGRSALRPGRDVHRHASTERTISTLMRWSRVSQVLIDPTFRRADILTRRAAKRLLAGLIADCLNVSPNEPTDDLIALGRRELSVLASFRPPSESIATQRFALIHAVAALRVADESCRRHCAAFPPAGDAFHPVPFEPDRFDASARRAGFDGGVIATLPPPRDPAVAFVLTSDDAEASVERLHERWGELDLSGQPGTGLRPSLLTRAMWPACRLLFPAPESGEALAARDTVWGKPPPLAARDRAIIGVGRTLEFFVRPRGRAFRTDRSAEVALRGLAADVLHLAPTMRAYRTNTPVGRLPPIPSRLDETELLDRLRTFIAEERPIVERMLDIRSSE